MTQEVHDQTNCLLCDAPSTVVMCRKCMSASKNASKEQELLAEISRLRIMINKLSDAFGIALGKELDADERALFREVVAEARAIFK